MTANRWQIVVKPCFRPKLYAKNTVSVCNIAVDCIFFHYLSRELRMSKFYSISFIKKWRCKQITFTLISPTCYDLIDYKWNERIFVMVRERCELDHALSWLSTFGGAFSALGDYYEKCAEIAGKISINQLKLALRLQDPNIISRCRLYFSLSLIQKQHYRQAKLIIRSEYECTKNALVPDQRLMKMCKGIWAKLQYEHNMQKKLVNSTIK